MAQRIKQIIKCFYPFYVYLGIQVLIIFIFVFVDSLNYMQRISTVSFSADIENLLTSIIAGSVCIIFFRKKVKHIFNIGIMKQISRISIKLNLKLFLYSLILRAILIIPFFILYFVNKDFGSTYNSVTEGFSNIILSIISICIIGPIVEEIIFRGIVLDKLSNIVSFKTANILQTFFFTVIHANLVQIVSSIIFGYVQGILVQKYNSIGVAIVLHIMFNCIGLIACFVM